MLAKFYLELVHNKNVLMLITAVIYILALFGTLSNNLIVIATLITLIFLILILKNLFPIKYIIIWGLVFYFGVINTSLRIKNIDDLLTIAPRNAEITGKIVSIPQKISEDRTRFYFDIDKIKIDSVEQKLSDERTLVTLSGDKVDGLKLYNSAVLEGRLSPPFKAGNPSQFDYGNYLRNHNTYVVFYAKKCQIISSNLNFKEKFLQSINDYRENIISVHSNYLKSPNLEILGGIVFGDDAVSPPKDIKQSFINSGLLHILAASGMNVAFIYSFFFMIMSFFRIPFKIRVTIGMLMVLVYSLMTGLGASVIRATCMLVFVLIGKLIDRDAHSVSLLSFVALLMLIYNPLFINDVGFQLSFIVTFGIIVMAPPLAGVKNKILNFIVGTVSIPVIAQLWVIPIQVFYFSNISVYSVFANIMSVPILMVLSFGGFVSSLMSVISPIANFVCQVFDFVLNPLLTLLVNISNFWGSLPHSSLQTTHPSIFQILVYYGILLSITGLMHKEFREKYLKLLVQMLCSLIFVLLISLVPIRNSDLEITAFDVGNADCFLIKTPSNDYMLVDTAKSGYNGGKSQAEIVVLKYLRDRGIKKINSIIITHFDNDHCGGAVDLLNELKVDKVYVNSIDDESFAAKNIYRTAQKRGAELVLAEQEQQMYNKSGLVLTNYVYDDSKSENDSSIITLLRYNNFTMLFTGDAGIEALTALEYYLPPEITVLKVPHHGAIGSVNPELVDYFNPKYSLISVGDNKFGHPSIYTLEVLKGTKILRTDVKNSIKFRVNKNGSRVYMYKMKRHKYKEID